MGPLINANSTDCTLRSECIIYMRYLSWSHRVLPFTFYLPGVVRIGNNPACAGGFSDIWKGRLGSRRVCIKALRFFVQSSNREDTMKDLISEVLLLRQLRHPNILSFLGVNEQVVSPSFAIITPLMVNGNLAVYLQRVRCSFKKKMELIRQVVEGLRYLHTHSPPVIHCDIKAGNIFVSEDETCCIGDFGLSILEKTRSELGAAPLADGLDEKSGIRGSLRWLAPELLNPNHATQSKSSRDIYALGCTIVEVITGRPPFYDQRSEMKIIIDVLNGHRPRLPPGVRAPAAIWRLVEACWQEDADARPDALKILQTLDQWLGLAAWAREMRESLYEQEDLAEGSAALGRLSLEGDTLEAIREYAFPHFLDTNERRSPTYEIPAFEDSLFDGRRLWDQPEDELPLQTDISISESSLSDVETETGSSEWWSEEDSDSLPTTPYSPSSPVITIATNDEDTRHFEHLELAPEEPKKALSEPVFPFRPPRGSVWNHRELQSAWSWYMDRKNGRSLGSNFNTRTAKIVS
ncbi:Homeobox protein tos8 [Marasmius crinis-equi]|uniref:Homeobox protein tos8 n=1 Tax=Marasmius crinis-equi TaxID=585013 RepID=A0ABR3FPM8_9AGAR